MAQTSSPAPALRVWSLLRKPPITACIALTATASASTSASVLPASPASSCVCEPAPCPPTLHPLYTAAGMGTGGADTLAEYFVPKQRTDTRSFSYLLPWWARCQRSRTARPGNNLGLRNNSLSTSSKVRKTCGAAERLLEAYVSSIPTDCGRPLGCRGLWSRPLAKPRAVCASVSRAAPPPEPATAPISFSVPVSVWLCPCACPCPGDCLCDSCVSVQAQTSSADRSCSAAQESQ
mmetsp:Transcript_8282/g.18191  ORF Transcript_8282/g.18191 Transcript_8282/m.18191 type:complete len:235 (+) Transcript_8282:3711-4415(+)